MKTSLASVALTFAALLACSNAHASTCYLSCDHYQDQFDYLCEVNVYPEPANPSYTWVLRHNWNVAWGGGSQDSYVVASCSGNAGNCLTFGVRVTVSDGSNLVCSVQRGSL